MREKNKNTGRHRAQDTAVSAQNSGKTSSDNWGADLEGELSRLKQGAETVGRQVCRKTARAGGIDGLAERSVKDVPKDCVGGSIKSIIIRKGDDHLDGSAKAAMPGELTRNVFASF